MRPSRQLSTNIEHRLRRRLRLGENGKLITSFFIRFFSSARKVNAETKTIIIFCVIRSIVCKTENKRIFFASSDVHGACADHRIFTIRAQRSCIQYRYSIIINLKRPGHSAVWFSTFFLLFDSIDAVALALVRKQKLKSIFNSPFSHGNSSKHRFCIVLKWSCYALCNDREREREWNVRKSHLCATVDSVCASDDEVTK